MKKDFRDRIGIRIKHLNLPIFLLLLSALCFAIDALGYIFISQVINFIIAPIIIGLTIKAYKSDEPLALKYLKVLYMFLPLIAIVFIIGTFIATSTHSWSYGVMVAITVTCSLILFFSNVDRSVLKYIFGVVYVIILAPIFSVVMFGIFLGPFMSGFGVETGRIYEPSPNAIHTVTAVQRSEGALGGSTSVFITANERRNINLLIGELRPQNTSIHGGRYSDFSLIEGFRWDGDYRLYMYRRPNRGIGWRTYTFELICNQWIRKQ